MAYNLFKSNNTTNPFIVISDSTEDNTSTSINFIGRRLINYGQDIQQSTLWLLENFANDTPPNNPINGQLWYDTIQDVLQIYDETLNNGNGGWFKVYAVKIGATNITTPSEGEFFYNTTRKKLQLYYNSSWIDIGPSNELPLSVYQLYALLGQTSNGTQTELFVDGLSPNRITIPNNSTWLSEISITAKRTDGNSEFASWKVDCAIDNSNNTVSMINNPVVTVIGNTRVWSVLIDADNTTKSLRARVTGEAGKTIKWTIVAKCTKVSS